jgi:hypothetical protein
VKHGHPSERPAVGLGGETVEPTDVHIQPAGLGDRNSGRVEVQPDASHELKVGTDKIGTAKDQRNIQILGAEIRHLREERKSAYVFINNRYEGNAPETIQAIIG